MSKISLGTFALRESRRLSSSGGLLVQSSSRLFSSRNVCTRSTLSASDAESFLPPPDSELGLDAVTESNALSEILGQSVVALSRDLVRRFSRARLKSLPLGYRRPVRPNRRKRRSGHKHLAFRSFCEGRQGFHSGMPNDSYHKSRA